MWIGPTSNVTRGKNSEHTSLEIFIHDDAAIRSQPRLLSQDKRGPHSDPQDDKIGIHIETAA
jgi:hypothetical protein